MAWRNYLQENRDHYRMEIGMWLEKNRGWKFTDAINLLINPNYPQVCQWLGDGKSAEWAAQELLAQQVTESEDETEDGR